MIRFQMYHLLAGLVLVGLALIGLVVSVIQRVVGG